MSKYVALVNFTGSISMFKGEERELKNKEVIEDLLKAKYIKKVKNSKENEDIEIEEVNTDEDK